MKGIFLGPIGQSFQLWSQNALQNIERWVNTLTEFRGATAARDGADGLVPQPKKGDETKFLCGDGTFKAASGGGGISAVPTPANNQIAIWTDATHIEGDADFTYDTVTNILGLIGTQVILVPAGTFVNLSLRSTDAGALGPILEFFHNSPSPAVGDVVAQTYYYGNNSAAASKSYGIMSVTITDPVAASEDSNIRWYVMKAGAVTNVMALDGAGITSFFNVFTTDEAYGATWDGNLSVPTKNAVYDKIQTIGGGFTAASQAEQEAASSILVAVTPGRQQYHPSANKAWVTFTSVTTTAITGSYNVSSLTDNGVGDTTVNFTVAFSSANYAAGSASGNLSSALGAITLYIKIDTAPTASACRMLCARADNNAAQDRANQGIIFTGDQ